MHEAACSSPRPYPRTQETSLAKEPRTFQCRTALWEGAEELAQDLACSVDYVLNEALKQYLRQRGVRETKPLPPPAAPRPVGPPPLATFAQPRLAPPPPPLAAPPRPQPMAPPIAHSFAPTPTHATHSSLAPPLPPPFRPPLPAPSVHRTARLWVLYEGQRHPVDGPAFVVGRGKQGVQLVIKDPNVSRRHALIELQDGRYWIADLGSVNGVEVNGVRIARKPIEHGDVLKVCDHTLKFSFE